MMATPNRATITANAIQPVGEPFDESSCTMGGAAASLRAPLDGPSRALVGLCSPAARVVVAPCLRAAVVVEPCFDAPRVVLVDLTVVAVVDEESGGDCAPCTGCFGS